MGRLAFPYQTNALARSRFGSRLGNELQFLKDLCRYWSEDFDWQKQDRSAFPISPLSLPIRSRKDSFPACQRERACCDSVDHDARLAGVVSRNAGDDSAPHLSGEHGLAANISFDLIVPSLPGFGFSDRPQIEGMNSFRVAEIWVELMRALGYDRFAAQGGDLGAGVSTALGLRHSEHLIGVHLNYIPGSYKPYLAPGTEITAAERQFQAEAAKWYDENGAYAHLQGTRPQTPAYALNDSPVGLAAWILEKFREWSDCGGDIYSSFSRDALLANVTLYWMTQTISSSFRMYREGRRSPLHFSSTDYVPTPCAITCFPKEIMMPPRSWVERGYNVTRWTTMLKGGHFAAAEEPELLATDLQAFFGSLRT